MNEISKVIDNAMLLVTNSLAETNPYDIDECVDGYRYIIKFTGKEEIVEIVLVEILDSDWILDTTLRAVLYQRVIIQLECRNKEFESLLRQAKEIHADRLEELGLNDRSLKC